MEQKKDGSIELTEKQMAKISGGDPGNLLFTGEPVKPVNTVKKGDSPKPGSLVHKEVKASGKKKPSQKRMELMAFSFPAAADQSCADLSLKALEESKGFAYKQYCFSKFFYTAFLSRKAVRFRSLLLKKKGPKQCRTSPWWGRA